MPDSAAHQMVFDHIKAETLLEALPDATLVCDVNGKILVANSGVGRLLGYGNSELVGRTMESLLPVSIAEIQSEGRIVRERTCTGQDFIAVKKDGSELALQISLAPFRCVSGEDFVVSTIRNTQESKLIDKNLRVLDLEKDLLLKELNHRIKNTLQLVSSLINLQLKTEKEIAARRAIGNMRGRLRAITCAYEQINSEDDLNDLSFKEYLNNLTLGISVPGDIEPHISISLKVEEVSIGIDVMISCGIIVNEVVSNSVKHAFPGRQQGEIILSFERLLNSQNKLTISDNGIGIDEPVSSLAKGSMGLKLIKGLTAEIGGQVSWCADGGTTVSLIWPV